MGDAAAIVDGVLADHPLAGISLGVVTRDGLTDTVLRGIATVTTARSTLDTVFRIGSVTKTMTALALLRQWEAGRFDLDDPVNDHLPDLELVGRPGWRAPTIRHLLTHTAGIGELVGMERPAASDDRARATAGSAARSRTRPSATAVGCASTPNPARSGRTRTTASTCSATSSRR